MDDSRPLDVASAIESRDDSIATAVNPLWFKDAVIYQVHVRAFVDSNADGYGDFPGLTARLDYIKDLGINTVWLLPFYPSPLKSDGYDVADYHNVHPLYGTRQDFRAFMREAHGRGLRVITELIVNHTSDQHPWFQAARRAPPGSVKRDYYVWNDDDQKYIGTRVIFPDTEKSNWTWDPVAKAYYWHRFFRHQPDLNFDNPRVLKAVGRTMRFWLDMGVDGFRLDAIPYLVEREGTSNENLPETHAVIRGFRALIDKHYANRVLLAEADQWPEDVREYFADGNECHMAYHFPLMPRIYMAIAQEDRYPIVEIMQQTPEIPTSCQWAIFLRNHDELTLQMVTSKERDYMYRMYAADPQARSSLGIRRRLAPLMENDPDKIKLMNSLLLSMPGSPIIYYGDEIGMGDNIFLGDRNGVRTPMQWSPDRNAGFSRADPQRLFLPPIMDAVYGYQAVNVEAQTRDPSSLLNWMRRILSVRRSSRAFGRGRLSFLRPGNRKVLAYLRETDEEVILCVANVSRTAQPVELDMRRFRGRIPVEMLGRTAFPPIAELPYLLTLPGHGFYWFRLSSDAQVPDWHAQRLPADEVPLLVLFDGWTSFFPDRVVPWRIGMAEKTREQLELRVLPHYVEGQRWYGNKGERIQHARIKEHLLWPGGTQTSMLACIEVQSRESTSTYFVPLVLAWEEPEKERGRRLGPGAVARVRQQARVGVLADAVFDEWFCRAVVAAIAAAGEVKMGEGTLQFRPIGDGLARRANELSRLEVSAPLGQGTNTTVALGERFLLKVYRRLGNGVNPELEMGRFLTEVAHFPNAVPVLGALEYTVRGSTATLAIVQDYRANSGDGWTWTFDYLKRFLEESSLRAESPRNDVHDGFLSLVQTLGVRTAELHRALSLATGDSGFDPEPFTALDLDAWKQRVRDELQRTLRSLESCKPEAVGLEERIRTLLSARRRLLALIDGVHMPDQDVFKIRTHGDYHLGQVLVAENDFLIVDFEGEPGRTLAERRTKQPAIRDVACMLRSFDYARAAAVHQAAQENDRRRQLLKALAANWLTQVRSAFLLAYSNRMGDAVEVFANDASEGLFALAELEKILYEIRYEIANRPAWLEIALEGALNRTMHP